MKKNKAIVVLLCILLILAGVTYIDIFGVNPEGEGSVADINLGLDLAGGVSITYQVVGDEEPSSTDMSDTIAKLQKRVEGYSTEAIVYQEGSDRINIEIPGVSDANAILQELGRPGTLYFISETDPEGNLNYSQQTVQNADGTYGFGYVLTKSIDELLENGSILVQGTDVSNAQAGSMQTQMGSEFAVSLTMTEEGREKFTRATQNAFDKKESLAIYYDGNIISAPSVNAVITDGSAQISPMESFERAENLASTIRIGGLKLELEELHSKVVGAQLGVEAIDTSLKAGAIGLVLVMVFMIVVYLIPGVASAIALLAYVALVILLLNGFDMTLTLSGVAGIILSIGMAVDANVIIFARIREELATGKTVRNAIKIGFDKALSAIIDGNITTLIAAGVLLLLGPGTVKGFAQTLALGIVLSMFTALVVTRWLMRCFFALGIQDAKFYGATKERATIHFLKKRMVFFALSAVMVVAGFVGMGINKSKDGNILNYSLDFVGGTSTTVTFNEDYTIAEIDEKIVPVVEEVTGDPNVQTQRVEGTKQVVIKTRSLELAEREALNQALIEKFGVSEDGIIAENISSTVSGEMKSDAVWAVVTATIFMLVYISFRFKDIRFVGSAVIALLHDVLVVLAFYAIAKTSVGNTFIACMLTIVGYSINATIVIFDRIRENLGGAKKRHAAGLMEVADRSITQTLSRSINTSLTTFIMVFVLFILGVSSIREFALPLMAGIICGGYSSVCITGALWYVFKVKFAKQIR